MDINYHLASPTVTTNGANKFLEFGIEVFASQGGTYLDGSNFIFDYNTAVFGNNIFTNG